MTVTVTFRGSNILTFTIGPSPVHLIMMASTPSWNAKCSTTSSTLTSEVSSTNSAMSTPSSSPLPSPPTTPESDGPPGLAEYSDDESDDEGSAYSDVESDASATISRAQDTIDRTSTPYNLKGITYTYRNTVARAIRHVISRSQTRQNVVRYGQAASSGVPAQNQSVGHSMSFRRQAAVGFFFGGPIKSHMFTEQRYFGGDALYVATGSCQA